MEFRPDWKLSFSQLQSYSQCGEKFYHTKLSDNRPPRYPAAWLVHGNALHSAVDRWHRQGEYNGPESLQDIYLNAWAWEMETQKEKCPDLNLWSLTPRCKSVLQDLKLRREAGLKQCAAYESEFAKGNWWIYEDVDDDGEPSLFSEMDFELELPEVGYFVRGHVDQVRQYEEFSDLVLYDLKTGSPSGTDERQLGLYGWALNQKFGLSIKWGRMFYTKLDSVPRSGDGLGRHGEMVDLTKYGEEYWNNQFGMLVRGVKNDIFLPNPGDNCRTCDALSLCSIKGNQ